MPDRRNRLVAQVVVVDDLRIKPIFVLLLGVEGRRPIKRVLANFMVHSVALLKAG